MTKLLHHLQILENKKRGDLESPRVQEGVAMLISYKFWIFYRLTMPVLTDYLSFAKG